MIDDILAQAKQIISSEVAAITHMADRLDNAIARAVGILLKCEGRVIVIGMGKSGLIGRKMSATFASTGTPSFFVHPAEAFHGDLGMIRPGDVALMISNSGETEELVRLLPFLQYQQNRIVALVGRAGSTLARYANAVLDVSVEREACANNLAPTSSTTVTLVMGDVLAILLSSMRNFKPEDFARFHPGGNLGRRLLTRVRDVMHASHLPLCSPETGFREVVQTISRGRLGMVLVTEERRLRGVITDGDLRRTLERHADFSRVTASDMMTISPKVTRADERFAVAEARMRELSINSLVVVDEANAPIGVLQIYDA